MGKLFYAPSPSCSRQQRPLSAAGETGWGEVLLISCPDGEERHPSRNQGAPRQTLVSGIEGKPRAIKRTGHLTSLVAGSCGAGHVESYPTKQVKCCRHGSGHAHQTLAHRVQQLAKVPSPVANRTTHELHSQHVFSSAACFF